MNTQLLSDLLHQQPLPVMICDHTGRVQYVNEIFLEMIQRPREDIIGASIYDLAPVQEAQRMKRFIKRLMRTEKRAVPYTLTWTDAQEVEHSLVWIFRAIKDPTGIQYYYGVAMPDGDHAEPTNRKLYNTITGLPKKVLFEEHLKRSLAQLARSKNYFMAVLYIDLDNFSRINHSYGQGIAEEFLVFVAKTLRENTRPGDTLVHFGSDKFAVILDDIRKQSDAKMIAHEIQYALRKKVKLQGQNIQNTASIGVVLPSAGDDITAVMRRADEAMHKAKKLGKNRVEVYSAQTNRETVAKMHIETLLHEAIESMDENFYYKFMPIVDLKTGRIVKFEALLRMKDPRNASIEHSPVRFIPIAEETQIINFIGRWGIAQACSIIASWQKKFPKETALGLSVNISYVQLLDREFVPMVKETLERFKIEPGRLRFEITETIVSTHADSIIKVLDELKQLSIDTLIDDFGAGNHSFASVLRMPSTAIKADKAFLATDVDDRKREENRQTLDAISAIGHRKNKHVIAEGVETEDQLRLVLSMNYTHAQGFWFKHRVEHDVGPVDLMIAEAMIRSQPFVKKITQLHEVA